MTRKASVVNLVNVRSASPESGVRLLARMAMLLAALAAVGLYAVVSHSIARRTREIGIRMALGARFGDRSAGESRCHAARGGGIVLGIVVAIAGSSVLENRLFGVERLDPVVYGAAAAVFAVAGVIALWSPLRAAGGVNPTEALGRSRYTTIRAPRSPSALRGPSVPTRMRRTSTYSTPYPDAHEVLAIAVRQGTQQHAGNDTENSQWVPGVLQEGQ